MDGIMEVLSAEQFLLVMLIQGYSSIDLPFFYLFVAHFWNASVGEMGY